MSYRNRNGAGRRQKRPVPQRDSDEEMASPNEQAPDTTSGNTRMAVEVNGAGASNVNEDILDDLPPFNPREFQHAPILAAHHAKIKNISDAWSQGSRDALDSLAKLVKESAVLLGDADENKLKHLDDTLKEVLDARQEVDARLNASMKLREDLTRGANIVNPSAIWDRNVEEAISAYKAKTSRQKYADNPTYTAFREELWTATNDGPMPPIKSTIPKEDGDADDSDDDVEMGGLVQDYRDPLTRGWLEDPMTSKRCGHSYSSESIKQFLKGKGVSRKCPAVGCDKNVTMADLEVNEDLGRQVRNKRRKEEGAAYARGRERGRQDMVVDSDEDSIID